MALTLQRNSRDPLSHTLCSMAWAWYKERTQLILYSNRLAEDSGEPPRADMNTYVLLIVDVHSPWDAMMSPLVGPLTASDCAEPRLEGTFMSQRMCVTRSGIDMLH